MKEYYHLYMRKSLDGIIYPEKAVTGVIVKIIENDDNTVVREVVESIMGPDAEYIHKWFNDYLCPIGQYMSQTPIYVKKEGGE